MATPVPGYKNSNFLASDEARSIRILCEHTETEDRLKKMNVHATLLIFGSARAKSSEEHFALVEELKEKLAAATSDVERERIQAEVTVLESREWMCSVYDRIYELARRVTLWSKDQALAQGRDIAGLSRAKSFDHESRKPKSPRAPELDAHAEQSIIVCTGGGPGFMEAANKGAASVEDAQTIGMGITLPFEKSLNAYVTESLAFTYHYFFTRKFWMVYHCQALVAAPGGVGTFDELFEVLTLKQTGRVQKDLPVVLFGKEFWTTTVNWDVRAFIYSMILLEFIQLAV